jgi:hypothetical protein
VKRFIHATLVAVGAAAALIGLGLLGINLYIQSPGTQIVLRDLVSENLGYPVTVFRITFTPWTGFHFENVIVRNPSISYPIVQAPDLWIQCYYMPLFRRKLIVRRISLKGGEFRIPIGEQPRTAQTAADALSSGEKRSGSPATSSAAHRQSTESSFNEAEDSRNKPEVHTVAQNFWVEIQRFKIQQGSIYLMGMNGVPAASMRNVEGSVQYHKGSYTGKVRISSATISDAINIDEIASPVKISSSGIDLENIVAQVSGGELYGSFHADMKTAELPYELHLRIARVNLNEIVSRGGGILDQAHGILEGDIGISGFMKAPSRTSGGGFLEVKTGYLDQFPVFKELGRWTQIDELQRLDLQQALSRFSVMGQDIEVDSLNLISKNCQVHLWGTIQSAEKLALNGTLTVSQFLSQKIPNELEENFVTAKDGRSRCLDFRVAGSLMRPQTDLFERIIGNKEKFFKKLLRSDRKDRRHEHAPSEPEQTGSPPDG